MVLPLSLQVTISFNVLVYTRMEQKQEQTKRDGFILKLLDGSETERRSKLRAP